MNSVFESKRLCLALQSGARRSVTDDEHRNIVGTSPK
jgi:hypothetical protein